MDYILDTTVKISWIEEKFLEGYPRKNKVHLNSWSAEITGENKGLSSFIIRLTLRWSEDDVTLPKTVIIKSPTTQIVDNLPDGILPEGKIDKSDDFQDNLTKVSIDEQWRSQGGGWPPAVGAALPQTRSV